MRQLAALPFLPLILLFNAALSSVLAQGQEDDSAYHFSPGTGGRAAWVVDQDSLPWIGSFEYLSNDKSPATVLMTVVDSSTGAPLGECSVMNADKDEWEQLIWTLASDGLTCNVSETNSSKVRFPLSAHPRTFSVRIQSVRGPRCIREMTVQNERPIGCPPHLKQNAFTSAGMACGCPYVADSTAEVDGRDPAFPILDLAGNPSPSPQPPAQPFTSGPCAGIECMNNGTCVVGADGQATCMCHNGFSGSRCQLDICASVPCGNGGKCQATGSTAVCQCPPHTTGILCEQIICEPTCAQGECTLVEGAPLCQCSPGFIGPNCNVIDVCIGDAACAVFGEHAKCTLDTASYTTVSQKVVNASYDCHCPHPQTGPTVPQGFRPFPSAPVVLGGQGGVTPFPTPAPVDVEEEGERTTEIEEEENLGAGFETMTAENGPDPSQFNTQTGEPTTGMSTEGEEESEETATQPAATEQPLWPMQPHGSTLPPTEVTESEETSAETTQSVLPFWMMSTTSTLPPAIQHPIEVTTRGNHVPTHEHAWPKNTEAPAEETTNGGDQPAGSANQARSSAASVIVAIIAVTLIGLLLLAAAFFTMRYVRQSRKLHGKYNPAREEHALSAAYSLPMTHAAKDERLI
ncbi:unnamed protein product, partial [Mesorhabditis spiculigera]